MIDARRMEVYMALYDDKLQCLQPFQARILESGFFDHYLENKEIVFFGDGAFKVKSLYPESPKITFAEFHNSAANLTEVAFPKFKNHDFEDVAYFEPFYLKDFIAGKAKV